MLKDFRARTLQWYVLREYLITFTLTLGATLLFAIIAFLFVKSDDYERFGISVGRMALLIPYLFPQPLAWAIPPAAMIAAILVFGRLSADNEIIAIQSGGAPLRTVILPLLMFAVLLSGFCLVCNQWLLRWGYQHIRNEVLKLGKEDFFTQLEKSGNTVSIPVDENSTIRINWLPWTQNAESGKTIRPLHIVFFKAHQTVFSVYAEDYQSKFAGVIDDRRVLQLTLRNAQVFRELPSFFEETTVEFLLPSPTTLIEIGESRGERGWLDNYALAESVHGSLKLRNQFQLRRAAEFGAALVSATPGDPASAMLAADYWNQVRGASEALNGGGGARERIRNEQAEAYRKIALSVLPLSMVVLGMGLGLLVQRSQRLIGFILGIIVYALGYYPIVILCKEFARTDRTSNLILFLPNILMIVLGYLFWHGYERGIKLSFIGDFFSWTWRTTLALVRAMGAIAPLFFRRKTDGYIASSFVGVFLGVIVAVAFIFMALDLVEHGPEVFNSIIKSEEPIAGLVARTQAVAILDAASFYLIKALEILLTLLPVLVLLAALLAVNAMVRNNEHLILKASGIPLQRGFRPILLMGLILAVGSLVLRESLLPELIMARDALKPQVYRRLPQPSAVALYTLDAQNRPVLFEMSEYTSNKRSGRHMKVYLLNGEQRLPVITADKADWTGEAWRLTSEQIAEVGKKDPLAPRSTPKNDKRMVETRIIDHGFLVSTDHSDASPDPTRPLRMVREPVKEWRGTVTPALLESDRVNNPAVMRLKELQELSVVRPSFKVEWWKRVSEWVMALVLLWLCLPLFVSETRSTVAAAGIAIGVAVFYWMMNVSVAEAANAGGVVPPYAPLVLHATLLLTGVVMFYRRMAT